MIRSNLIVTLDEDVVSGDTSVISMKTTDAGNIVIECTIPKVAIKLEDLEQAIQELRSFISTTKHIVTTATVQQMNFEYTEQTE